MQYNHPQLITLTLERQRGAALIVLLTLLSLIALALHLRGFNQSQLHQLKFDKTRLVLAEAKSALLAYAAEPITATSCNLNCPRPGDLPCPDLTNNGVAASSCNTQASRLGRLPWKTLGLNDLRDGDGEHLWYAVSERFKNNTRVLPLNGETHGTISLRNAQGHLLHDASNNNGLVALVIAPHASLLRADNIQQLRTSANQLDAQHYLDIALNEDNSDFVENQTNGFITGLIKQNDRIIANDIILPISTHQIQTIMQKRVLSEVFQAMLNQFCSGQMLVPTRSCNAVTGSFYPSPAAFNDTSCLSNSTIATGGCLADDTVNVGRIPVTRFDAANNSNVPTWDTSTAEYILDGAQTHNWFQQNNWREQIIYARATACSPSDLNCSGTGFLTVQNSISPKNTPQETGKQIVLISAGAELASQSRSTQSDKSLLSNYLEDENLTPNDTVFARNPSDANNNDLVTSIP